MINGDECRITQDKNKFTIYRIGNNIVQVFYRRQSNQPPRILDLPKCLVELIPNEYEPSIKEVRTRVMKHAREDGKGWTFERVRKELISEKGVGGAVPNA